MRMVVAARQAFRQGQRPVARAIHNQNARRDRTFVRLNCAAIPSGLLESELFGYEKGAFTGALAQKRGRIELAQEGSLFLDGIGDISLDLQPEPLRVLQKREFESSAATRP
jgi:formate hydrogenlyase transcriptional activator